MSDPRQLAGTMDEAPIVRHRDGLVARAALVRRASALADRLPNGRHALNLCCGRGAFLTAFLALLMRGQTMLLPPSRAPGMLEEIGHAYDGATIIAEAPIPGVDLPQCRVDPERADGVAPFPSTIPPEHVAAVTFTSGTTGTARPNPKSWRSLLSGAELCARRFGFEAASSIVATVPPQHMYGLETSIMLPLAIGAAVHDRRPLFPHDVALCPTEVPPPRTLITTPIHLRACLEASCVWQSLDLIISATAPLAPALAERAERKFDAPVREIYGCSEAGSLASRRTVESDLWLPYDGVRLIRYGAAPIVQGGHVEAPVRLADVLVPGPGGQFRIVGRQADMVSIAGKRASLGDLNLRLTSIEGISDGVFIAPEPTSGDQALRLAALYVSEALSEREVLRRLAEQIDPVFLPRPIRRVERLPRNELGKLPRAELLALVARSAARRQAS